MGKTVVHAKNSARKFGGKPEDFLPLHDLMDSSKSAHATMRHRAIFHSAFGIYLVEKILGHELTLSDGTTVPTRSVAEQHVIEDLGRIPSLDEWLQAMDPQPWMFGGSMRNLEIVD